MRHGTNPLDRRLGAILGGRTADALDKHLEIRTVDQLLRHYPRRYERRGQMTDLSSLQLDEHVTVMARVVQSVTRDYRDKRAGGRLKKRLELTVTDGRGSLLLTFFGKGAYVGNTLRPGTVGLFAGKVGEFRNHRQLLHPDFVLLSDDEVEQLGTGGGLDGGDGATGTEVMEAFVGSIALDVDVVRGAFAAATSPGRLEVVRRSPVVVLDAAHNPAGVEALVEAVAEAFSFSPLIGVVGVMADKEVEQILSLLEPVMAEIVCTQNTTSRAMPADELGDVAEGIFGADRVSVHRRLDDALDAAAGLAEQGGSQGEAIGSGGVLVTGSVITVGEARRLLGGAS